MKYEFVLTETAARSFSACGRREQTRLLDLFTRVAASHHETGRHWGRLPLGREIEAKQFGAWVIAYWVDAPVRRVVILDCEKVR